MSFSMIRKGLLLAVTTIGMTGAVLAQPFSWDGAWVNKAGNRTTVITIAKGKVVSWSSNGENQPLKSAKVTGSEVTIEHAQGARVRMVPKSDGTVSYTWTGNGQSSTRVMTRR